MKKSISLLAKIKLRDNKHVVIYYRNTRWKTGITVNNPNEFSNGRLTSKYSGAEDYQELNIYLTERLQLYKTILNLSNINSTTSVN